MNLLVYPCATKKSAVNLQKPARNSSSGEAAINPRSQPGCPHPRGKSTSLRKLEFFSVVDASLRALFRTPIPNTRLAAAILICFAGFFQNLTTRVLKFYTQGDQLQSWGDSKNKKKSRWRNLLAVSGFRRHCRPISFAAFSVNTSVYLEKKVPFPS